MSIILIRIGLAVRKIELKVMASAGQTFLSYIKNLKVGNGVLLCLLSGVSLDAFCLTSLLHVVSIHKVTPGLRKMLEGHFHLKQNIKSFIKHFQ